MKFYFLLLYCLIPLFSYSQNGEKIEKDLLPNEIKQYYKNLNLANSFSTPSEKSAFVKYLQVEDSNKAPISKRQTFVMNLLKDVMQKELEFEPAMPNASNTSHLYSRMLHEVQHGYKEEDFMAIRIKVYQLSTADNFKIISFYDEEKDTILLDGEIDNLSTPKYVADEIHEWIFSNDSWHKKELRKVLVR